MGKNKQPRNPNAIKTSIGGQALMEGIMMRGPKVTAMAVRNTQGEIVIEKEPTYKSTRAKITKLPVIRGLFNFYDSMKVGYKALMRSAEISGLEEAEEEMEREKREKKAAKLAEKKGITLEEAKAELDEKDKKKENKKAESTEAPEVTAQENTAETADAESQPIEEKPEKAEKIGGDSTSGLMLGITVVSLLLALVLMFFLFKFLPLKLFNWTSDVSFMSWMKPENKVLASLYKSVFEGLCKLILIVGYMAAILLMKDIRRVFRYHGAEHKTIFCYEAGLELNVENVRKQRRFHPRCGTSFIVLMMIVSIFVSFFIDPVFIAITGEPAVFWQRLIVTTLLIPINLGLGYELIKLAGKHDNILTRIISAPGMWLQHITVLEPDDSMIECAIAAVKEVIPEDGSDRM